MLWKSKRPELVEQKVSPVKSCASQTVSHSSHHRCNWSAIVTVMIAMLMPAMVVGQSDEDPFVAQVGQQQNDPFGEPVLSPVAANQNAAAAPAKTQQTHSILIPTGPTEETFTAPLAPLRPKKVQGSGEEALGTFATSSTFPARNQDAARSGFNGSASAPVRPQPDESTPPVRQSPPRFTPPVSPSTNNAPPITSNGLRGSSPPAQTPAASSRISSRGNPLAPITNRNQFGGPPSGSTSTPPPTSPSGASTVSYTHLTLPTTPYV